MRVDTRIAKIATLTRRGVSQKMIARRLCLSRGTVYRAQKKLGLQLPRHGPRCPEPTDAQRQQILELLATGMGTIRIADRLGLAQHAIRRTSQQAGFRHTRGPGQRHKLPDVLRVRILADIREHSDHALNLAQRYHLPYKVVLRMAHEELACPKFRCGHGAPLLSDFPQKEKKHTWR